MNLTGNQIEALESLYWTNCLSSHPLKWATPLDLGASNGSHHSASLNSLAKKGLVQFKQRGAADPPPGENGKKIFRSRGSKCYRITEEGIAELTKRR